MNTMKNFLKKCQSALMGKKGASNVEIIVWISVVLVLATVLFLFREAIEGFITSAIGRVNTFTVN